jgi:hypothetical protein
MTLRIDLQNNVETFIKESRQDSAIARWARARGISVDYLQDHPHITDVIFLLEFRDEFQKEYRTHQQHRTQYDQYWRNTYCLKRPLKPKAFRRFEQIALDCLEIRHNTNQVKQRIMALRGTSQQQNTDQDSDGERIQPARSSIYEKGTTGRPQECLA